MTSISVLVSMPLVSFCLRCLLPPPIKLKFLRIDDVTVVCCWLHRRLWRSSLPRLRLQHKGRGTIRAIVSCTCPTCCNTLSLHGVSDCIQKFAGTQWNYYCYPGPWSSRSSRTIHLELAGLCLMMILAEVKRFACNFSLEKISTPVLFSLHDLLARLR